MTSLTDIALHYGTDKAQHTYTQFYETLFVPLRKKPIKLLEIGVAGGESMKVWNDWFQHRESKFYGVEIQDRPLPDLGPRTQVFITDACSPNAVYDITNAIGKLDIWIDDGSHYVKHQKQAMELWWPHINSGGLAIIEDTHSSYFYPWWDTEEVKFVHSLNQWIDRLNENGKEQSGRPTDSDIEEIIFRKSLVVIKKR